MTINCKTCPIKKECDQWFNEAVKQKLFKKKEREVFCPLVHGAIIGLSAYLGQSRMLDIIIPTEDSPPERR